MTTHSTNLEQKRLVKELFDMVYMWGKVRVVVDETAPAFKAKLKEVIGSANSKTNKQARLVRKKVFGILFPNGYEVVYPETEIEEGYPKIDAIISEVRESVIDECIEALPKKIKTLSSPVQQVIGYNQAIADTITNLNALKGKSK